MIACYKTSEKRLNMRPAEDFETRKGDYMNARGIVFAVALLSGGPVIASDNSDVIAVVNKWVDSFNKGDSASGLATCDAESAIIDSIPPYEWHGAGACSAWFHDFNTWAKQNNAFYGHTTIDKVRNVEITGTHAYAVVSATFTVQVKDKTRSEKGIWTFGMRKGAQGWRITGWAWTPPPSPPPAK